MAWIFSIIAILGFDSSNLNNLTIEIPFWRQQMRLLCRYLARILLWTLGVYSYSRTKLTYKDLHIRYGYKRPDLYHYDIHDPEYNKEPKSYIIVSNHLGYLDILLYLAYYNTSFICSDYIQNVTFIGDIATCFQSLFLKSGIKTSHQILHRVQLTYDTHSNRECNGCYLCSSKLIIFPESTTTNSKQCLLPFRSSIFRSGKPIQPIIIRSPYKHFNTTWESIHFMPHLFRLYTQCYNKMEVVEAPPYIPNKAEINDPYLYSFNVNQLMRKMLGHDYKVYLLNRDHKKICYHPYLLQKLDKKSALNIGKQIFNKDTLIQKYVHFIHDDISKQPKTSNVFT